MLSFAVGFFTLGLTTLALGYLGVAPASLGTNLVLLFGLVWTSPISKTDQGRLSEEPQDLRRAGRPLGPGKVPPGRWSAVMRVAPNLQVGAPRRTRTRSGILGAPVRDASGS